MTTSVDVVLPVLNEERDLPRSVATLHQFLTDRCHDRWRIVIADNGSTDNTLAVSQQLSRQYPHVAFIHLEQRGRGRALKRAWLESTADIVSYMDVDLSTDLQTFPQLIAAIRDEGYDLAVGSRLAKGAQVANRTLKREILSRGYNLIIRAVFFTRFSDAQCGFKAISRRAAQRLLPLVQDNGWFLDTELLILAERRGFRIKDVPAHWTDDPDTRVRVWRTVMGDLRGLLRLRVGGIPHLPQEPQETSGPSS
ncbi:MAG: glycosyltransferase family 2 protein [Dehalococcoidia bacterium]|nr:glycosyltransferase family 2 protein [Dehalococcoidia bacterium]